MSLSLPSLRKTRLRAGRGDGHDEDIPIIFLTLSHKHANTIFKKTHDCACSSSELRELGWSWLPMCSHGTLAGFRDDRQRQQLCTSCKLHKLCDTYVPLSVFFFSSGATDCQQIFSRLQEAMHWSFGFAMHHNSCNRKLWWSKTNTYDHATDERQFVDPLEDPSSSPTLTQTLNS